MPHLFGSTSEITENHNKDECMRIHILMPLSQSYRLDQASFDEPERKRPIMNHRNRHHQKRWRPRERSRSNHQRDQGAGRRQPTLDLKHDTRTRQQHWLSHSNLHNWGLVGEDPSKNKLDRRLKGGNVYSDTEEAEPSKTPKTPHEPGDWCQVTNIPNPEREETLERQCALSARQGADL